MPTNLKLLSSFALLPKMMPTEKVDVVYPSGVRLVLLMVSVFIGMFLVALVRQT
jgi:hypothetical protein